MNPRLQSVNGAASSALADINKKQDHSIQTDWLFVVDQYIFSVVN
jgi:hypothetical protein